MAGPNLTFQLLKFFLCFLRSFFQFLPQPPIRAGTAGPFSRSLHGFAQDPVTLKVQEEFRASRNNGAISQVDEGCIGDRLDLFQAQVKIKKVLPAVEVDPLGVVDLINISCPDMVKYVPNIFEATAEDFVKVTNRVHRSPEYPSGAR